MLNQFSNLILMQTLYSWQSWDRVLKIITVFLTRAANAVSPSAGPHICPSPVLALLGGVAGAVLAGVAAGAGVVGESAMEFVKLVGIMDS